MASPSRRTGAQSAKRAAVEARVLAAAEGLLGEGAPYAELSVDRIARQAGISRPAFYFYFRDKRELLMRLTEDVADRLYAQAEGWWAADEGDGAAALAEALGAVVALYRTHGVLLRAVVEASTYDEQVAGFWRAVIARFADATRARIEAEQAAGRATDVDAAATAFALAWMTERTVYQHMVQTIDDDAALVRALVGIWVRAVYSAHG
jgi:TetR/AcrR family transcriptional regulator, ethionamide resistance regulator